MLPRQRLALLYYILAPQWKIKPSPYQLAQIGTEWNGYTMTTVRSDSVINKSGQSWNSCMSCHRNLCSCSGETVQNEPASCSRCTLMAYNKVIANFLLTAKWQQIWHLLPPLTEQFFRLWDACSCYHQNNVFFNIVLCFFLVAFSGYRGCMCQPWPAVYLGQCTVMGLKLMRRTNNHLSRALYKSQLANI